MTGLSENARALFDGPNFAHLAVLRADGAPHVSAVWVDREDDRILVNTAEGRVKARAVADDPRVALSIVSQSDPYRGAFVRGEVVELRHEGAREHIDTLARKYRGWDRYPAKEGETRVILVIEPSHVVDRKPRP